MNSVIRSSAAARRWSPTSSITRSNGPRQAAACVTRHTRSFMTCSSLRASSTVGRAPPRLEIGMTHEHTLSSGRREGGQTLAGLVFLQTVRRQGEAATPPAALHRRVARRVFPRSRSNAFHRPSTPSFGQCSALNCTHLKKFVPSGTPTAIKPHPAPRSCRGNGACATKRPLQTPGLLQVPVCQTISRNQRGHLHLASNLVAMSATHSTNQVSTRCWLGTLPLRLRSTSVSLSKPLNNFHPNFIRAVVFRIMVTDSTGMAPTSGRLIISSLSARMAGSLSALMATRPRCPKLRSPFTAR